VARARRGDLVDGVLLLDKPSGITSNLALQRSRRLLNAAKAGHTGTLDPLASGLLPLTFGEATKFSQDLLDADKSYEATILFGVTTTTGDAEGETLATRTVDFTGEQLDAVLLRFSGTIEQVPPMHSALKKDGRALYRYARQGIEIERDARTVTIHRLELLERDGTSARVALDCSKGTYVRALAADIGAALGCGAHLAALRRTRVGAFVLERAVTLAALETMPAAVRREWLLPVDALIESLPRIELDEERADRLRHGQQLHVEREAPSLALPRLRGRDGVGAAAARVRLYCGTRLLGVASIDENGRLSPQRLISTG